MISLSLWTDDTKLFDATVRKNLMGSPWFDWSARRVKSLEKQWVAGVSAETIAEGFGTTRSSVVGKVRRLRLPPHIKEKRPQRKQRRIAVMCGGNQKMRFIKIEPHIQDPILVTFNKAIPLEQRKNLLQIGLNECRFPVGDPCKKSFFFCGAKIVGKHQYCAIHDAAAYLEQVWENLECLRL